MEEGLIKAILAIEMATGKKPRRIEMDRGCYLVKFHGVDVLLTMSQAGYFMMKYKEVVVEDDQE